MMDIERMERIVTSAARLYREINKPFVRSRIDMTHDFYADEEADEPMLSVDVKGEPKIKLMDLMVFGSAIAIFMAVVCKILGFLRRR